MASKKELRVLNKMLKKPCITSREVEGILGVSNKTARKMIALLNDEIVLNGAEITAKPGKGYSLIVHKNAAFEKFLEVNQIIDAANTENRSEFLIRLFIDTEEYLKVEELADMLYISQKGVSKSLKEAEHYLHEFDLNIIRKPHYGMRVDGKEYDIRRCLSSMAGENDFTAIDKNIIEAVDKVFKNNEVKMSEMALTSFLISLQITVDRVKKGKLVEMDPARFEISMHSQLRHDIQTAKECVKALEEEYQLLFPEDEINYIALNIMDKKYYENNGSLVINEEINLLVTEILDSIYKTYGLDFRKDLDFYMMLVKHLIPLRLRLLYGTMIKNPILEEVKGKYPFAWSIASGLNHIIKKHYDRMMSDDELGYIAIAVQLAIDKHKKQVDNRKNILLVCAAGNVFSRFLKYRFQELFKDCIEQAYTCDYSDLRDYDFSKIDYVFSTVPLDISLPVPIYKVEYFPDESEMGDIRTVLQKPASIIEKYFSEKLFLTEVEAENKSEVIRQICNHIAKAVNVPEDFYDLVMKRESLLQTAMGGQVAVPHPHHTVTDQTLICVAILKNPIYWNKTDKVKVVFLISISQNDMDDMENFYSDFFKLALTKENIDSIVKSQTYENLMSIVRSI